MSAAMVTRFLKITRLNKWGKIDFEAPDKLDNGTYFDRNTVVVADGSQTPGTTNALSSEVGPELTKAVWPDYLQIPGDSLHRIVLDIDHDAALIESSTEGHHHLVIDKIIPWNDYVAILDALAQAGVIEIGYYEAAIRRGATWLRAPWTKKEIEDLESR